MRRNDELGPFQTLGLLSLCRVMSTTRGLAFVVSGKLLMTPTAWIMQQGRRFENDLS